MHACAHECMCAYLCISAWVYSGVHIVVCADLEVLERVPYIPIDACIYVGALECGCGLMLVYRFTRETSGEMGPKVDS